VRRQAIVLSIFVLGCSAQPSQPLLSGVNLDKARELVRQSQDAGLINRYTCVGNEAYVNPVAWAAFNVDEKRGMAISLGAICEAEQSGSRMTIYDYQSGRKLAYFDGSRLTVE
jgi:hypothetical protein